MPSTTTPRRPLRLTAAQNAHLHDLYAASGLVPCHVWAANVTGRTDLTDAQLLLSIGTHGWIAGTNLGDQSYQRRMARLGRGTPRLGRRGQMLAGTVTAATVRHFGIEVEFNNPDSSYYNSASSTAMRNAIVADCTTRGVGSYLDMVYGHRTPTQWKMTYDTTTSGGEFVSPVLPVDDNSRNALREVLAAVKAQGGTHGPEQGMHIHHDVRDFSAAEMVTLVNNLRHAEAALLAYVPAARYSGTTGRWSPMVGDYGWNRFDAEAARGVLVPGTNPRMREHYNRYQAFNMCAVLVQGSVEFRALGNTLNAVKVWTWVATGSALIAYTKAGNKFQGTQSPESLIQALTDGGFLAAAEGARFLAEVARRAGRAAA